MTITMSGNTASNTMTGTFTWNGAPVIDDDEGGTAGVREPRRPHPAPLAPAAMAVALDEVLV